MMTSISNEPFGSALELGIIICSALFATVMSFRSKRLEAIGFITFLLQSLTFLAGVVVLVGLFVPGFLRYILDQPSFLVIMAMMTVIYSGRDIIEHIANSRSMENKRARSHQDSTL